MSQVRFIGCLHLGHTSIAKYRGFETEYQHDEHLISQWNKVVHKKDLTYILGDITMEKSNDYYQLDRLNGRKVVVLGNHDRWQDVPHLLNYVDGVAGMIDYKGFTLTHAPIHVSEIGQYRGNIHAHIHHKNVLADFNVNRMYADTEDNPIISTKGKYFCVDAKLIEYQPKTIQELLLNKQD
jgi:calcineurin-like phosphoesterase family protein